MMRNQASEARPVHSLNKSLHSLRPWGSLVLVALALGLVFTSLTAAARAERLLR